MKESLVFIVLAFLAVVYISFPAGNLSSSEEAIDELKKNFLVSWKWETTDGELIKTHSHKVALQMNGLWKQGNISDVYFNSRSITNDPSYSPGVSFVLRSETLDKAKQILNSLILVKKGIVKPSIRPVGMKWLGRNESIVLKESEKTFIVVWNALRVVDPKKDRKFIESDFDLTLKYHELGMIENAYWNVQNFIEGRDKSVEDLVFFVRATSEIEVKSLCEEFSFSKRGIASYEIKAVGSFWLDKYKEE